MRYVDSPREIHWQIRAAIEASARERPERTVSVLPLNDRDQVAERRKGQIGEQSRQMISVSLLSLEEGARAGLRFHVTTSKYASPSAGSEPKR